ncbi:MAG: hypothetical protein K6T49_00080 [Acidobacterium ailaaui]|jgi:hypothetical protein|nr:hypothetical protein [Pseudacidobacterium ailaaui]
MTKTTLTFCMLCLSSALLPAQDNTARQKLDLPKPAPSVLTKTLPDKGTLVMEVNVGELRIVRSKEDKTIQLTIDPKVFYDEATVRSWVRRFDVAGGRAFIDLKLPSHGDGHHSGPEITVAVPAQTDLKVEVGVGELTVKEVEGNKDLHVGIGELTVGAGDGSSYHEIQTSSKLGEAEDNTSHQHSEGFFPKTHRTSVQGLYRLQATVGIGQVNVVQD